MVEALGFQENRGLEMLAKMFAGPLAFVYWIVGLWGFFLSLQVLHGLWGILGVIAGLVIAPVSYFFAPLYAGFAEGYWLPAIVSYAPVVLMTIVSTAASAFDR
jgi:hypothetical protein